MENSMKSVVSVTVINTQLKEPHSAVLPNHVRRSQCSMEEAVEKSCCIIGVTPADFGDDTIEVFEDIVEDVVYYEALTPREMAQRQREEYVKQYPIHVNDLEMYL